MTLTIDGIALVDYKLTQTADPIDVTKGPEWGVDENGELWTEPGDTYHRYIAGPVETTLTVTSRDQLADATPGTLKGDSGTWMKVSQTQVGGLFKSELVWQPE